MRTRRLRMLECGFVLVLAIGFSACGDGSASQKTTGPYAVGTRSLTFEDDARETPAFGDVPAKPTRTVITDIWYPASGDPGAPTTADAAAADDLKGTAVMFLHGTADQYPIDRATAEFNAAAPPRFFVTIDGGNHSEDFRVGPRAELAAQAALHFFDLMLKDRADALDALDSLPGVEAVPK